MKPFTNDRYQKRQASGLKYGIIEVTSNCQCACPGCYMVRRQALNKGEMSLKQVVKVLDLCRDYIGKELETMDILGGEPLLWSELKDYLKIVLNRGIQPWIFTNMLAITPALANWLWQRKVHITGKLNINPANPLQLPLQAEMIGRSQKVAKRLLAAIDVFLAAGYQEPLFRLQNLIRRKNIELAPGYYRWCLQRGIGTDLELMGSGEAVGQKYWEIAPTLEQIAMMIKKIQVVRQEFGLPNQEVLMPHIFGSCPFYDKGLYFAVDGSIRACSNSTIRLSNVNEAEPIKKAYESSLICQRLQLCQEKIGEPCRSCDRWERCRGGCRATVEGLGDPWGGYPLCPVPYLRAAR